MRIRTSKHSLKFTNVGKIENLGVFIAEYRRCLQWIVDRIWDEGYEGKDKRFSVREKLLDLPSLLESKVVDGMDTFLTGRALKCCMTQASGLIRAETEKQRKRLFILGKRKAAGDSKTSLKALILKIKQNNPVKPNCANANPELNSICCDFQRSENFFNGFIRLTSITKTKLDIRIPISFTRHSLSLASEGEMLKSFLICKGKINIRWNLPEIPKREEGLVLGGDQGLKDTFTLSSGSVTEQRDCHGHSQETIVEKVGKKKRGSNAFQRAKEHQRNFINWTINNLNFRGIKTINLEEIRNINFRRRSSKKLFHWQNTLIRNKIEQKCENEGVRLTLQSSTYRSQRCCQCGNVRKANRKGKNYECRNCGNIMDADLNAAKNHEAVLPDVPYDLRKRHLNRRRGFFWKLEGFFDFDGTSLQSVLEEKIFS